MQTNCNEVVVLQQGEHSSVNNSRRKRHWRKGWEPKVQFKREPLIIFHGPFLCDGHTNGLIGLSMLQNLLWVNGMAWMTEISRHETSNTCRVLILCKPVNNTASLSSKVLSRLCTITIQVFLFKLKHTHNISGWTSPWLSQNDDFCF